ncbi:hypothetical protein KI387_010206 [Taxus chinensis]|uniref:Nodulation signaling pathway 2-like protein n=1 Tax=Taxus chinensis TaxID=29808 RepID=A0AA38FKL5_TAXCH|nr:hypothetical protein KI387_010206 [Taxus chinensis]
MMEKSGMQGWSCNSYAAFITAPDFKEETAFFDFGLNSADFPGWNHAILEENGSEDTFMPNKCGDEDLIIDDYPPEIEDLMVYDEMFSDFSSILNEDLLMDVGNESEGITMEEPVDSDGAEDYKSSSISSETFNTSACSTDSEEYKGLCLVHLLTACAEAISDGAHDLVQIILCRLRELVSATGSTMERVAYYLSQSLQQGYHLGDDDNLLKVGYQDIFKDPNYLGAFSLLNQVYPYIRFAHFTANQSILEAIPSQTQKVIHIIDFDIMEGMQWPPLMEALKSENYKIGLLKITAVIWDDDPEPSSQHTERRLRECADSLGIPFSFQETQLDNFKKNMANSNEEEIVIANCMWGLPHMFERNRKQLIQFIDGTHRLNPTILTVGGGPNGTVTNEKQLSFMDRFDQRLKNVCAVFDSVEAGLPEQYAVARVMVERLFMGPLMCRPIKCSSKEDDEESIRLVDIPLSCGFTKSEISKKNVIYAKYIVEQGKNYITEIEGNNHLILLWKSTPLTCVSTWKPASCEESQCSLDTSCHFTSSQDQAKCNTRAQDHKTWPTTYFNKRI